MVLAGRFASSRVASNAEEYRTYLSRLYLPISAEDEHPVVSTSDTSPENLAWLRAAYPGARLAGIGRRELLNALEERFGVAIAEDAVEALARTMPSLSAKTVATPVQMTLMGAFVAAFVLALALRPHAALDLLGALASLSFVAGTLFRAVLAALGDREQRVTVTPAVEDETAPVYTILVPLYHEARVLPRLIAALRELDYPKDKLDIKLIVESDDAATASLAGTLAATGPFHVVRVPQGTPRTKPRACNYALAFARGEFTVIYDAEDRPERDQLKRAVAKFRKGPRSLACLQARLNFYNARENWLTRLFALDYSLWFDALMPGLERLGLPMPLGGTSNHFRTSALHDVAAWDPFNVTEDADMGIRLAQCGMRVSMLESTTYEEAPTTLGRWIRQRSRWMKGYAQTWLVHTRAPHSLCRRAGLAGLVSLQLFVGATVLSALLSPLLWLLFVASFLLGGSNGQHTFAWASGAGLLLGNAVLTWLSIVAPRRRGWSDLAPYGTMATAYWALISIAAWRGVFQLFTRPFHWDKTEHGLSRWEPHQP